MRELAQTRVRFGYRRLLRAAATRRLGGRQRALLSRLHRGRPGAATEAAVAARDGGASRAAAAGDGAQRHLEHGLRRRRARRWPAVPHADGAGSLHARVPRHRRRARAHAARMSSATLERLRFDRGLPQRIYCDNGTEFVSAAMDLWAYTNDVILDFSRRGKPTDNAAIESFNGRFRDECLNVHWFAVDWRTRSRRSRRFGGTTMRIILTELSRASALGNSQKGCSQRPQAHPPSGPKKGGPLKNPRASHYPRSGFWGQVVGASGSYLIGVQIPLPHHCSERLANAGLFTLQGCFC